MHSTVQKIIKQKKKDLKEQKQASSLFKNAIERASRDGVVIIGEIKFASPTHPYLGSSNQLIKRALAYQKAGVDAISIVTEKHYFKGDSLHVPQIKKAVSLPVLQKDFVLDEYQIYEAKVAGADALLFIARLVSKEKLKKFVKLAQKLGIEPIVEVYDENDLQKAVATKTLFIAVNARDLNTFTVDVAKACELMRKIPDRFIKLGFSGVESNKEVMMYKNAGAKGVLVGTSLMKAKSISDFLRSLR